MSSRFNLPNPEDSFGSHWGSKHGNFMSLFWGNRSELHPQPSGCSTVFGLSHSVSSISAPSWVPNRSSAYKPFFRACSRKKKSHWAIKTMQGGYMHACLHWWTNEMLLFKGLPEKAMALCLLCFLEHWEIMHCPTCWLPRCGKEIPKGRSSLYCIITHTHTHMYKQVHTHTHKETLCVGKRFLKVGRSTSSLYCVITHTHMYKHVQHIHTHTDQGNLLSEILKTET